MAERPWDGKNKVAIVGVGFSKIGRMLERPTGALAVDASLAAIADAGLTLKDIDGLAGAEHGNQPGLASAPLVWMVEALGIERVNWWGQSGSSNSTIGGAINALANNNCDYVLAWGANRQVRGGTFGSGTRNAGGNREPRPAPRAVTMEDQFSNTYGLGDGELTRYAPAYMRYMQLYGAKREHMATYALQMRAYANRNPNAMFYDQPLSYDDYMNCRMIADPLCLFDCDMPIDGAVAIVLARADKAKNLKQPPAYVTAYGTSGWNWQHLLPNCSTEFTIQESAGNTGRTLWASTDMKPKDMDGFMFFDGFASNAYFMVEGMGLCKPGEAYEYIQDGRMALDGEMPMNTMGGNISEGRLGGMGHWVEAVRQVQGRADDVPGDHARQIPNVENILCVPGLGLGGKPTGIILSKDPR